MSPLATRADLTECHLQVVEDIFISHVVLHIAGHPTSWIHAHLGRERRGERGREGEREREKRGRGEREKERERGGGGGKGWNIHRATDYSSSLGNRQY